MPKNPSADKFNNHVVQRGDPGTNGMAIPNSSWSDTVDLTKAAKALRVLVPSGVTDAQPNIRFTPLNETNDAAYIDWALLPGPSDSGIPIGARRIWLTATTPGLLIYGITE